MLLSVCRNTRGNGGGGAGGMPRAPGSEEAGVVIGHCTRLRRVLRGDGVARDLNLCFDANRWSGLPRRSKLGKLNSWRTLLTLIGKRAGLCRVIITLAAAVGEEDPVALQKEVEKWVTIPVEPREGELDFAFDFSSIVE
ncbi:hypothetical protein KFL_012510030 [Klebsormidium nitens]|uniref:Uncharacterized protein n=1 Tax=Klebsormidium nitens TaxID=105231 RepID=A0A1Y1IVV0_KLENI|nr:hypothetical protein KFL_012510030 [Klebsormidium nitens]|eukprot:GAQ93016.1 hypothetical protein KFL_012510030 [Klebsormidium nitens]